jgi:hypothetical protein
MPNTKPSLNARIGALTLFAGAAALISMSLMSQPLSPLRLLTMAICTFGVWAFCDEMGMRKPLNRAGFVAFSFGCVAKAIALIDTHSAAIGRYYLLYAFAILFAMLLWSIAFLHRQRDLKVAGTIGAIASIAPILALVIGHLALGAGFMYGIGSLMEAADGGVLADYSFIKTIDVLFAIWSLVSAWFLWRGYIKSEA